MNDWQTINVKKGNIVTLDITSMAFGGQGIGHLDDFVIFVDQTLPGQTVAAKIYRRRKNYAEARLVNVIHQSPHYQQPRCLHFGACGGCRFQHLKYQQQLEYKEKIVVESLERLGGFKSIDTKPILASPDIFYYRNKMEYSFSPVRWFTDEQIRSGMPIEQEELYLGLHVKNFYDKIVDVQECHLLSPESNRILKQVRRYARQSGLPAYDSRKHTGFWRFIVIRPGKNTNDMMVNLVAYDYNEKIAKDLKSVMRENFPCITSLIYSTTRAKSDVAFSENEYLLDGNPTIIEKLGPFQYEISANSFFQTNTLGAERLYNVIARYADIKPGETLYDLYCGAGTISIYLSKAAARVVGFESVLAAVEDGYRNAVRNEVDNCEFILGDLRDSLCDTDEIISRYGYPDILVIDPPRGGMHSKTVDAILHLKPKRIVHVSCNPTTLARDLKILCHKDYHLLQVQPVDMFPHTAHIEAVVYLEQRVKQYPNA